MVALTITVVDPRDLVVWVACLVAFFGLFCKFNLIPASPTSLPEVLPMWTLLGAMTA